MPVDVSEHFCCCGFFYVFGRCEMDSTKKAIGAQYGAGFNRPSEAFAYANAVVERNLTAALRSDFEMKQAAKTAPKKQRKSLEK